MLLYEKNGIILNREKFQFCQEAVQFGGLQLTSSGVTPCDNLLNAISSFPTPKNITDPRSCFGLFNQVAWAYPLSPIMLPFWRCPWCNGYCHRKWTRWLEFKSWTRLIAFHIALISFGKVWSQSFSLQLWVNSRADWFLQPWWGN